MIFLATQPVDLQSNRVHGVHKWICCFCTAIAALLLAGCATTPRTGESVQISIAAPREAVHAEILTTLARDGWQIVSESTHSLRMEGAAGGGANFWFTNALTGERPRVQLQFTIVEIGEATQVSALAFMRHAPGLAGGVAMTPLTGKAVHQLADILNGVQQRLQSP